MDNFHAQLPNPAITYPFELDPFQKRAILRLEEGQVFFKLQTKNKKVCICCRSYISGKNRSCGICYRASKEKS